MRRIFIALLFALILSAPALIAPAFAQNTMSAAIEKTISDQISAFEVDDFATAFSLASPTIKGVFGTSANFGAMVQRGYPMVHRPGAVRMLGLREVDGDLWQRIMVTDQAGTTHMLDYNMIETPEGWQINAVQLLPQSGVGA